ncbi:uncharacterized protein LOC116545837 [Sapajus apella]|uniref:Uncharacterized protein LOC116545837 n=1 Tax=Sapajus apella TaxID=9515 RepID=A0A6J3HE61_SAPAP|nr:uncharacterized protein LOC116545837 [Sapajus apella]
MRMRPVEAALRACRTRLPGRARGCSAVEALGPGLPDSQVAACGAAGTSRSVGRRGDCGTTSAARWASQGRGVAGWLLLGSGGAARRLHSSPTASSSSHDRQAGVAGTRRRLSHPARGHRSDRPLGAGYRRCLTGARLGVEGSGDGGRAPARVPPGWPGRWYLPWLENPSPDLVPFPFPFIVRPRGKTSIENPTPLPLGRRRWVGCVRLGAGSLRSSASRTERVAAGWGRQLAEAAPSLGHCIQDPELLGVWPLPPGALPWLS